MITVHLDTLKTTQGTFPSKKGPVTIDRRIVRCHPITRADGDSNIAIYGLAVRFRTGTKVWPASATYWLKSGNVNNLRPNIDKFTGQFCQLVGYFADHEHSTHRSQHNAVA